MEDSSGEILAVLLVTLPETQSIVNVKYFIDEVPTAIQTSLTYINIILVTLK